MTFHHIDIIDSIPDDQLLVIVYVCQSKSNPTKPRMVNTTCTVCGKVYNDKRWATRHKRSHCGIHTQYKRLSPKRAGLIAKRMKTSLMQRVVHKEDLNEYLMRYDNPSFTDIEGHITKNNSSAIAGADLHQIVKHLVWGKIILTTEMKSSIRLLGRGTKTRYAPVPNVDSVRVQPRKPSIIRN
jgi:hypothetical protein